MLRNKDTNAINGLVFPTHEHQQFIDYLKAICSTGGVALVKGSLAKGTSREYSDVDIILHGDVLIDSFDRIVSGFDRVLLSEHFSNHSTYYVVYENGLTVEYDLRNTISETDLAKGVLISSDQPVISTIEKDRICLDTAAVPYRHPEYTKIVISQMCLLKLLCGKVQMALDIFSDRMKLLNIETAPSDQCDLLEKIDRILKESETYGYVSADALAYMKTLLLKAACIRDPD